MGDSASTVERVGRFRIVQRLGSASSRDVFLAEDDAGVRVVLKVLSAPQRNKGLLDPAIADEATAYARLSHPNIVKVVDLFSEDGRFVIALEYVDGATLNVLRAALKRASDPLDDALAIHVAASMFAAIAAAHDARDPKGNAAPVLHRNVNPSNVHVAWDGVVKLANFNVANVAVVLRDSSPGFTWGSYGYHAPEQVKHEDVGPPADVYSASLVLWELLAGRKAIERGPLTDAEVLTAMADPRITSLDVVRPDVEPRVRDALNVGLRADPKHRSIAAAQMRDVLSGAVDGEVQRARLTTALERVRPEAGAAKGLRTSRPDIAPPKPGPSKTDIGMVKLAPPRPKLKPAPEHGAQEPEAASPGTYRMVAASEPPPKVAAATGAGAFDADLPELPLDAVLPAVAEKKPPPVPKERPKTPAAPVEAAVAKPASSPEPAPFVLPSMPAAPPPDSVPAVAPAPPAALPQLPIPVAARPEAAPQVAQPSPPSPSAPATTQAAIAIDPVPRGRSRVLPIAAACVGLGAIAAALVLVVPRMRRQPIPASTREAPAATKALATTAAPLPASATSAAIAPAIATASATATALATTTASATATASAPAIASIPVATASVVAAASTAPSSDRGELRFPPAAAGHRIFVDGRVVGDGSSPAVVRCGPHDVRIGSAGTVQHVDVPCGGTLDLSMR